MRIGHGYDVHRFTENRPLVLGGVNIPYEKGLLGHSDADVVIHAAMDALLGAAGLHDLGYYFPDSSKKYEGIDSTELAKIVSGMLRDAGYKIINIDITVIAQEPKLAPYIDSMRQAIAEAFGIHKNDANIKATTEEHLGFTGAGLGIAAHAVVLIDYI